MPIYFRCYLSLFVILTGISLGGCARNTRPAHADPAYKCVETGPPTMASETPAIESRTNPATIRIHLFEINEAGWGNGSAPIRITGIDNDDSGCDETCTVLPGEHSLKVIYFWDLPEHSHEEFSAELKENALLLLFGLYPVFMVDKPDSMCVGTLHFFARDGREYEVGIIHSDLRSIPEALKITDIQTGEIVNKEPCVKEKQIE